MLIVVADWTNKGSDISKILEKHKKTSRSFYPLFPAVPKKDPIILPQNLTKGVILKHLNKLKYYE